MTIVVLLQISFILDMPQINSHLNSIAGNAMDRKPFVKIDNHKLFNDGNLSGHLSLHYFELTLD